jgi:hypothetical protein
VRTIQPGSYGRRWLRGIRGAGLLPIALAGSFAACSSKVGTLTGDTPTSSPPFSGSGGGGPVSAITPTFGQTVTASVPPPPISGGTLLATRDGTRAVAADPDRDSVYVIDLHTNTVASTIALTAGDEPGRLVEDGAGRVHVALRSGGALVTIDPSKGAVVERRSVCAAPRGVAWDSATDLVWVACATGELVALPAAGGQAAHSYMLERDLRDVVVGPGSLAVTKFRSAEVLRIAGDGTIARRDALPSPESAFSAHVAWRTVAGPSGSVVAVHQAESTTAVQTQVQGGYGGGQGGGGCGGPLPPGFPVSMGGSSSGVDVSGDDSGPVFFGDDAQSPGFADDAGSQGVSDDASPPTVAVDAGLLDPGFTPALPDGALPGLSTLPGCLPAADGGTGQSSGFFTQAASNQNFDSCLPAGIVLNVLTALGADGSVIVNNTFPGVLPVDVAVSPDGSTVAAVAPGNAFTINLPTVFVFSSCGFQQESTGFTGIDGSSEQPVAVTFAGNGRLLVQTREPSELHVYGRGSAPVAISLSSASRADTGHDVFHTQAGGMIACASCHPEGRDDGHVWILDGKSRRTPSLQGTIAGTAPYHWPGDQADLNVLVNDVYTVRMSGILLPDDERTALTGWVQTVPAPPGSSASSASQRGRTLFERADVGCATCHSGPKFTNNQTVDVGTGGMFQVPPLVGVAWRTPLMHDGCAATLADRFGACSTPAHGSIGSLSAGDISDLIAYLETL